MLNRGLGMIEILIVVAIIGLFLFGAFELITLTTITNANQERRAQATQLTQEGIEAVRALRAASWSAHIADLTSGANYYAVSSGETWSIVSGNPGPIDGVFTRTITLDAVNRDADDNISSSGTPDPDTRLVTSAVTWQEHGQARTVTLKTYLTNFLSN